MIWFLACSPRGIHPGASNFGPVGPDPSPDAVAEVSRKPYLEGEDSESGFSSTSPPMPSDSAGQGWTCPTWSDRTSSTGL